MLLTLRLLLIASLLSLSGCFGKQIIVPSEPARVIHPELPSPVQPYSFDWKIVPTEDGKNAIVGLDYNQSIEFRVFLEDIKRYTKELNSVLCVYRAELNEERCKLPKK